MNPPGRIVSQMRENGDDLGRHRFSCSITNTKYGHGEFLAYRGVRTYSLDDGKYVWAEVGYRPFGAILCVAVTLLL
jgi:hypothetical protein